jgi:hypothetical protein
MIVALADYFEAHFGVGTVADERLDDLT